MSRRMRVVVAADVVADDAIMQSTELKNDMVDFIRRMEGRYDISDKVIDVRMSRKPLPEKVYAIIFRPKDYLAAFLQKRSG